MTVSSSFSLNITRGIFSDIGAYQVQMYSLYILINIPKKYLLKNICDKHTQNREEVILNLSFSGIPGIDEVAYSTCNFIGIE